MPFVILDRDGVINYDSKEYIKSPDEWHPIPGSLEAIARLNQAGFQVLVATNQSGIARGLYDEAMLQRIHDKLTNALSIFGGKVEEIFFCPHHPDEKCSCRKPATGLFEQIQQKYDIDLSRTYFIGDSLGDIQAAKAIGCVPILVHTGNGLHVLETYEHAESILHFSDLASAVHYILAEQREKK